MTECPSEVNFLQSGNKNSLRIFTIGFHRYFLSMGQNSDPNNTRYA